ncbi:hypothetical protein T06_16890 [Trichinella sp. T6]|nr:hypothetical protein T06_16890 [Trichinella sp. T6]
MGLWRKVEANRRRWPDKGKKNPEWRKEKLLKAVVLVLLLVVAKVKQRRQFPVSLCRRLLLTRVHVAGTLLLTLSTSLVGDRVSRAPFKRQALRSMSQDGIGEGAEPKKRSSVTVGMSGNQATAFALASSLENLSNGAQKRKHTSCEMFIEGEEVRIVVSYSGHHPGRRSDEQHTN